MKLNFFSAFLVKFRPDRLDESCPQISSRISLRIFLCSCGLFLLWSLLPLASLSAQQQQSALKLPPGFQAQLFAEDSQVPDIQCLTTNAQGQIVVSGPGYIRILSDLDGDGKAETVQNFADSPASGAQGLFVDGTTLYCIGDAGLMAYQDEDQDGIADGPPRLIKTFRTGGEHYTHAIRKGPDGWWYVIAGNESGLNASAINTPRSPLMNPHAGVLLRMSPDFAETQIICDGFRNAYDFDFNSQGDIFAYDSDGERDISLPWYRPTRVFHSVPGLNHGWVSRSWKKPAHFAEMSPVMAELGRGSPTGVVCYQHHLFPQEFHDTLFVLDWTYGRIHAVRLQRNGASWAAQAKVFATGQGDFGFAPTDAEVGQDGALYVSVGGRGTQGGIFRITYSPEATASAVEVSRRISSPVGKILNTDQPLSAWSRAVWEPQALKLGEEALILATLDSSRTTAERIRALEILDELFQGPDIDLMRSLSVDEDPEVRARGVWAYGRSVKGAPDPLTMLPFLNDKHPVVIRQALEALLTCPMDSLVGFEQPVARHLGHSDRVVRQLAVQVATRMSDPSFREIGEIARTTGWPEAIQMARAFVDRGYLGHPYAWHDIGLEALKRLDNPEQRLTTLLLIQHALGGFGDSPVHPEVFDGYLPKHNLPEEPEKLAAVVKQLEELYPTGEPLVDLEMARLTAMLSAASPVLAEKLFAQITQESDPRQDLHHLIVLACLPVARTPEQTAHTATALLELSEKLQAINAPIDRNWEPRVLEIYERLVQFDPELPRTITAHEKFGRPEHTMFVRKMGADIKQIALDKLLAQVQTGQWELTPELMMLFVDSPSEQILSMAREAMEDDLLQPTALLLLAQANRPEDQALLLEGLTSSQWEIVAACLEAIAQQKLTSPAVLSSLLQLQTRLSTEENREDLWQLSLMETRLMAERLWQAENLSNTQPEPQSQPQPSAEAGTATETAEQPTKLLSSLPADFPVNTENLSRPEIAQQWKDWSREQFPEVAARLEQAASAHGTQDWEQLIADIDWSTGVDKQGEKIFQKQQCAQCHVGRNAIGPNLEGVAQRFSLRDLMVAIFDPHRDVSSRYQATMISTVEGKTYTGIIIYESVDGLLLRDSTHRTIRIKADDIEFRKLLKTSLMPENLLKSATPQEIADLYAYLKSLNHSTEVTQQQ